MGLKITTGSMSVKQNGQMVPIGVFTGSDAALQQEVSELKEDLRQKIEETESRLSESIIEISDTLNDGTVTYKNIEFEVGSINTNTGEPMNSPQIRSIGFFIIRKGNYVVHNPTAYRVRTFEYSINRTYNGLYRDTPANSDITRTLEEDTIIRVVLLSGSTDISLGVDVSLRFECGLKKELSKVVDNTNKVVDNTNKVVDNTNKKVNNSAFNVIKGKRLLPMLSKPTVVFIDDDGQNSVLEVTKPIFDNIGLPFVIGCSSTSEIFANVEAVKALENVEIALHPINTDQDLTAKTYAELNEYFNNQLGYMYDNGISVENVIYGGSNWSNVLCDVASRYFDCACSINSASSGLPYSYNVPLSAKRYALTRCKVTSTSSLNSLENLLTNMLTSGDSGLLIYYHHSWELSDNAEYRQKLSDLLSFVKSKVDDGSVDCKTLRDIWH